MSAPVVRRCLVDVRTDAGVVRQSVNLNYLFRGVVTSNDKTVRLNWLIEMSSQVTCYHCGGAHSPMACPLEHCSHCGALGHWDFICPTV
jgi:hypothetical protein